MDNTTIMSAASRSSSNEWTAGRSAADTDALNAWGVKGSQKRSFVNGAANDGKEPRADLLILRCVRMQQDNFHACRISGIAMHCENRPFR
jgi:hypothetical protein